MFQRKYPDYEERYQPAYDEPVKPPPPKEKPIYQPIMPEFAFTGAMRNDTDTSISLIRQQTTWIMYMVVLLVVLVVIVMMMQIMMFMKTARINSQPLY